MNVQGVEFGDREHNYWSWGFGDVYNSILYIIENYGWHLLILFIIIAVIYQKTLKSYLEKYRQYRFEREYAAKYHKNPDVFAAHVNAQQSWAEKMQEKYNREAAEHQRKMKEREERKKQELSEKYEASGSGGGYRLGGDKKDEESRKLKPDYNPLMGAGNSSSYRPPRRSPCGGGGCGR